MIASLPRGWIYTTIGEVTKDNVRQHRPKLEEKFRYINISSIDRKTKQIIEAQQLLGKNAPSRARRVISVSDVLVSMTRPNLNAVAMVPLELDGQIASTGLHVLRSVLIDPRWLFYLVRSNDFISTMSALAQGVVYPAIRSKDLRNYEIPLAPLNEQKRIANKLDTLLARINACQTRLERVGILLKHFRQAVLAAATSGELTEEWPKSQDQITKYRLVSLAETGSDFRYGSSSKSQPIGKVPVLRMGNIQNGKLDWNNLVFTSNHDEIEKYKLFSGDVLFNRTNSPQLVGKTAVFKGDRAAIYAGYLIRIRCGSALLPDYLNYCLNSRSGEEWRWRVKSDSVSQSNINAKKLASFKFILPTIEEQKEIVRRVETLFNLADRLESRCQMAQTKIENLRTSLLSKAFLGELVPQDPNDEPASVLLEQIRVEQAIQSDKPKRTRRPKRNKMSNNSIKKAIKLLPQDHFSFDELRDNVAGDYEKLKGIIFDLLNETEPSITQLFDEASQTMHFVRSNT